MTADEMVEWMVEKLGYPMAAMSVETMAVTMVEKMVLM